MSRALCTGFFSPILITIFACASACSTVAVELVSMPSAHIQAAPPSPEPPKEKEVEATSNVKLTANKLTIDEKIQFEPWSAKILEASDPILNEIADVLRKNAQIKKVEIQGHTAKTGQAKRSLKLSVDRAHAVKDYLVKRGVVADRLDAKGYGENQPIADNSTKEGKEKNRRVEFVILDQDDEQMALKSTDDNGEKGAHK
jgi:OOP family OmpA-OmpF porin